MFIFCFLIDIKFKCKYIKIFTYNYKSKTLYVNKHLYKTYNKSNTLETMRSFTHYTLEVKCKVLSHLHAIGGNISKCSREYDIPRKLISKWVKQQDDIFASTRKRVSFRVNNKPRKRN